MYIYIFIMYISNIFTLRLFPLFLAISASTVGSKVYDKSEIINGSNPQQKMSCASSAVLRFQQ